MISATVFAIAGVLVVFVAVRFIERVSVYFPERAGPSEGAPMFGPGAVEVWISAGDRVSLNAVYAPSLRRDPEPDNQKGELRGVSAERNLAPVVLYLHGNAGHLYHRADKVRALQELGADVLILDYRGYGKSKGKPGEEGLYRDAEAGYLYLKNERLVSPEQIVVYGESLGGAPAVHLATQYPVAGLICEGCFTSAGDLARTLIPLLPFEWLLANKFPVLWSIRQVKAPVLFLHAEDDEIVPYSQCHRLYESAKRVTKATLVNLKGGHHDAYLVDADHYRQALHNFLISLSLL
ncbi:MAG: alpha/beta hydrolase [bacterium JZ-2024 1]